MVRIACMAAVAVVLALAGRVEADDPLEATKPAWPPKGTAIKIPISKDAWIAAEGSETRGNNGGAAKWKLKGRQEFTLFDADLATLKGKIVTGALLHLHAIDPKVAMLTVSVSSVATPWEEGTGASYDEQPGAACYAQAALGKRNWSYEGSTFTDASFGRGHTIWRFAHATRPDAEGWQTVAIDPDVVAARVAGVSSGFGIWDDVGSEWSHKDGKFSWNLFPNRFFHSREQKSFAPWLEVWVGGEDKVAPEAVKAIAAETKELPAGEALVTWNTPADQGGGKTLGFAVRYKAGAKSGEMPRYLVPMAGEAGEQVRMYIEDLPFEPGQEVELTIRAIDSAGNVGQPYTQKIKVSANPRVFEIAKADVRPFEPSEPLPEVGGLKVAILDLADKVEAKTGAMVPEQPKGYKGGNHLWSAQKKVIRLQAAKNEHVCFQVNLEGQAQAVNVKLAFAPESKVRTAIYRLDYVQTKAGMMPDIAVPLKVALAIPAKDDPEAAGQTNASVLCEAYVPHGAAAGLAKGQLTVAVGGQTLQVPVELSVWDFTLPNTLSWVPEMNAYGTGGPEKEGLAYYRLAHEHRTCLTRLYYHWNGSVDFAPKGDAEKLDWTTWAQQFGPLFTGQAFRGLPRDGEPVDRFYLPFNEGWPLDYYKFYTKAYWPEEAFGPEYRTKSTKVFSDFAKMANARKWHDTMFWFFLNGKVYNKGGGWERAVSTWVMDEPVNTIDFWALRWYGLLWHQAVDPVKGDAKMWYRADISYGAFGRNTMWGALDMECIGGAGVQKSRVKKDEQVLWGRSTWTHYGAANRPDDSNIQPVVWCLTSWVDGSVGVVPWDTIGDERHWSQGEQTAVLLPHKNGPMASVRLKAFRQGQQMVEYLTLLEATHNQPQYAVAAGVQQAVNLTGTIHKTSESDAGTIRFEKADPTALWALRYRVGEMVSAKKPEYQRCVKPIPQPQIDVRRLPDIGMVRVGPQVEAPRPE